MTEEEYDEQYRIYQLKEDQRKQQNSQKKLYKKRVGDNELEIITFLSTNPILNSP